MIDASFDGEANGIWPPMADGQAWRDQATCAGYDPELFYGPRYHENQTTRAMRVSKAREVCGSCAVRAQCLSHALEAGEEHGIWGGLTEDERRALRRMK